MNGSRLALRRTPWRVVVNKNGSEGDVVCIRGYVKSKRRQREVTFMDVTDGTVMNALQVVGLPDAIPRVNTGSIVEVFGTLKSAGNGTNPWELCVESVVVLGDCAKDYPIQKKKMSMEHLRDWTHLRGRTNTIGAVLRVRNRAFMALHEWYQTEGFINYPTPLLTSSDCEGAGEMLKVTHSKQSYADKDVFGAPAYLSVSGQLHLECGSYALGNAYTFGPAFRAENSHTRRHLAEFYMLEAELFYTDTIDDIIRTLSGSFKHVISTILKDCAEEIEFFQKWVDEDVKTRLENELERPIVALTYSEAVNILAKHYDGCNITWGEGLNADQEQWLAEEYCKGSVFVTDYPSSIKPFYMLKNDYSNSDICGTVACVDMIVPRVCELAGGSLREHRYDILQDALRSQQSPNELKHTSKANDIEWYLDLRKYGGVPHGGFGLGFERLVQYLTGVHNIRDVIPFPRTLGAIKY
eukprot:CFRG4753T1